MPNAYLTVRYQPLRKCWEENIQFVSDSIWNCINNCICGNTMVKHSIYSRVQCWTYISSGHIAPIVPQVFAPSEPSAQVTRWSSAGEHQWSCFTEISFITLTKPVLGLNPSFISMAQASVRFSYIFLRLLLFFIPNHFNSPQIMEKAIIVSWIQGKSIQELISYWG